MMKTYILPAVISLALSGPLALATETDSSQTMPHPSAAGQSTADMKIQRMEEHLKKMRTEMAEIRQIRDPEERKKRLNDHLRDMVKMMKEMRQSGSMMSEGDMAGATMEERMTRLMKNQAVTAKRMDMMLALMEQMLQSQAASTDVFLEDILKNYDM